MLYPTPEIPDDSEKKSGTDWVLPKNFGSGRVSGTRQTLLATQLKAEQKGKGIVKDGKLGTVVKARGKVAT